jgi:sulfatase modifying factor 1
MIGNVGEWCWDWHGAYNNDHGILIDPTGPTTGDKRITRGGNYTTLKMFQISPFCRSAFDPGRGIRARGFRVARNAS